MQKLLKLIERAYEKSATNRKISVFLVFGIIGLIISKFIEAYLNWISGYHRSPDHDWPEIVFCVSLVIWAGIFFYCFLKYFNSTSIFEVSRRVEKISTSVGIICLVCMFTGAISENSLTLAFLWIMIVYASWYIGTERYKQA